MLVLLACLGQPCLVVVAILVHHLLHLAINGEPVGMHIEQTHEDGDHEALLMEILVLHDFLYNHYLTVGRSNDKTLRVVLKKTYRTTVKIQHNKPCCTEDYGKRPEWNLVIHKVV